jgi:hypothetical protein
MAAHSWRRGAQPGVQAATETGPGKEEMTKTRRAGVPQARQAQPTSLAWFRLPIATTPP